MAFSPSDDDLEAWEYLKAIALPHEYAQIEQDIAQMRHDWNELPPGATEIVSLKSSTSDFSRARVRFVAWDDGRSLPQKAIYKVFRPHAARYLNREAYAYTELAKAAPQGTIPKLLARGKNWLIFDAFDYSESEQAALWRTDSARQQLADWIRWLASASGERMGACRFPS